MPPDREPTIGPRTSLLPPTPGRHHWGVVVPGSADPLFDGAGRRADHDRALVQALWSMGIGSARFDLVAPSLPVHLVHPAHPAAVNRHVRRIGDVLSRVRRLDPDAEMTLVATGDAIEVATAVAAVRRSAWPTVRGLLLLAPPADPDGPALARRALDVARLVGLDERRRAGDPGVPVTRRLLRRLGW
jgi:hypothetical protein